MVMGACREIERIADLATLCMGPALARVPAQSCCNSRPPSHTHLQHGTSTPGAAEVLVRGPSALGQRIYRLRPITAACGGCLCVSAQSGGLAVAARLGPGGAGLVESPAKSGRGSGARAADANSRKPYSGNGGAVQAAGGPACRCDRGVEELIAAWASMRPSPRPPTPRWRLQQQAPTSNQAATPTARPPRRQRSCGTW